jgi:hypothetical protein
MNSSFVSLPSFPSRLRARAWVAGIAIFGLASGGALFAQRTEIRGDASATGSSGASLTRNGTGLITASGSAGSSTVSQGISGANAFASASADYGRLGVFASSYSQWSPIGGGNFNYQASANAEATFYDTITFYNPSLANGASLNVTVSAALDGSVTASAGTNIPAGVNTGGAIAQGGATFNFSMSTIGGTTLAQLTDTIGQFNSTQNGFTSSPTVNYQSQVVTVQNGFTYYISGDLTAGISTFAYAYPSQGWTSTGAGTADALHTGLVGFQVTGGTTYTTGSRTVYVSNASVALPTSGSGGSSSVPDATSTLAMLGLGLGAMGLASRAQRRMARA